MESTLWCPLSLSIEDSLITKASKALSQSAAFRQCLLKQSELLRTFDPKAALKLKNRKVHLNSNQIKKVSQVTNR